MFKAILDETFNEREKRILALWRDKGIFKQSVDQREGKEPFIFYDGPPFATGLPHYGHLLAGTIKDVIPRYKTMKGFHVGRRFGWDCHGLPIENEIEKARNLSGAKSIEAFGIAKFNEECRSIVQRYTAEWKETVERMGRWVDFDATWKTMDPPFMESVWWVFGQLWEKGLVYEGYKVMPFSAKLGTPLSNFEAGENYKDVDDPSLTIAFSLQDDPTIEVLAWTTTPWTLVSNLALLVSKEVDYVKIHDHHVGKNRILAKDRLAFYYVEDDSYTLLETFKGEKLLGLRYKPLFDYFKDEKAFVIIEEESVSTEEGTGIVHAAPAFGEVDFYACQRAKLPLVCPVDNNGHFQEVVKDYAGLFVRDADKEIIKHLKMEGKVVKSDRIRHRYPFCWRSDTPLIYKVVRTWFVAVEQIKDKMMAANQQIYWMPGYLKEGRFGKWLEGARDWAISRNRYWGTPIPIWRAEDGQIHVVTSIGELETLTGKKIPDIHRHFIDDLTFVKEGKVFRRIPEVFDCWFESGSMPYAQNHYPFENKDLFEKQFPADFIAEGLDQTRGWFYVLTVLAAALFDSPAFKNVIVNGIILAEDGNKMSKRLKNYPDPTEVIEEFGADAVRLYMLNSQAAKADDLCFSKRGVELVVRQILIPFWNAYAFFITYARIYHWSVPQETPKIEQDIDKWILSLLENVICEVEKKLDAYDLMGAVKPFVGFIDQLTNWYIRRSRRRFWSDQDTPDRQQTFFTLYTVLLNLSKVAAPFTPFLSEAIYQNLRKDKDLDSVHLCNYPQSDQSLRNTHLEGVMEAVQRAVSLGHALRKEHKLRVRQPLSCAYIISKNEEVLRYLQEQKGLIEEELNVKKVCFTDQEAGFVQLKAKPNFRILGKKVGSLMPKVKAAVDLMTQEQLASLLHLGFVTLQVDSEAIRLTLEDVEVIRDVHAGIVAQNEGNLTVALETELNHDLIIEGLAREVVNKVNTMRRELNFEVSDRIELFIDSTDSVKKAFDVHGSYIQNEVLAVKVHFQKNDGTEWDLDGERAVISLKRLAP